MTCCNCNKNLPPFIYFDTTPITDDEGNQVDRVVRATPQSAAYDIIAAADVTLVAGEAVVVDLGIRTDFNPDYGAFMLPRSGHGFKYGVQLLNTVGLIDADFRNNWKAKLTLNPAAGVDTATIPKGNAIVQFALVHCAHPEIHRAISENELSDSVRGLGGLGSTDKK